jgi:hypothetical protein
MLLAAKLRQGSPQADEHTNQSQDTAADIVVEIIPADWPQQRDPTQPVAGKTVVLAEFLALEQQGDALGGQQPDQVRLELMPARLIALNE